MDNKELLELCEKAYIELGDGAFIDAIPRLVRENEALREAAQAHVDLWDMLPPGMQEMILRKSPPTVDAVGHSRAYLDPLTSPHATWEQLGRGFTEVEPKEAP